MVIGLLPPPARKFERNQVGTLGHPSGSQWAVTLVRQLSIE